MHISSYWDIPTVTFYLALGMIGMEYLNKSIKIGNGKCLKRTRANRYDFGLVIIWTIFATFRLVNVYGIGGTDAHNYADYFITCLQSTIRPNYVHYEPLYKIINIIIRHVTSDYRVYFAIVYGFVVFSYIWFVKEFSYKEINKAPYILMIYVYIRGFCTLRTNLAASFILISIIFLRKKKIVTSIIIACAGVLIQRATIIYVLFLPFYFVFKGKHINKIDIKKTIVLLIIAYILGRIARNYVLSGGLRKINSNYTYYASQSVSRSFLDNFWKIAFEQMVLFVFMIYFKKYIKKDIVNLSAEENGKRLDMVWIMCMFDIILIPVAYLLGIWRAYEYFYIPRIIMWGEIVSVINRHKVARPGVKYLNLIWTLIFIAWLVFRWYNTWEDSDLTPYVFAPFNPFFGIY